MNDIAGHHSCMGVGGIWFGFCVAQDKCEVKNAGFIHTVSLDVSQDAAQFCPLVVQRSVTRCLILRGNFRFVDDLVLSAALHTLTTFNIMFRSESACLKHLIAFLANKVKLVRAMNKKKNH